MSRGLRLTIVFAVLWTLLSVAVNAAFALDPDGFRWLDGTVYYGWEVFWRLMFILSPLLTLACGIFALLMTKMMEWALR